MQDIIDEVIDFLDSDEKELIINGPAGSGKSTLLSYLKNNNILPKKTLYTATTNKAATVLTEILDTGVITIFSALRLIPFDNYTTGKTTLRQTVPTELNSHSVIVIDEAYTLTGLVLDYLDAATQGNVRLIYIGDSYQLPPVFHKTSPVSDKIVRTITLSKIWRTDSPEILELSTSLRRSVDTLTFSKLCSAGDTVQVVDSKDFIFEMAQAFNADYENTKVLAWTNNAVINYNSFINKLINNNVGLNKGDIVVNNKPIITNNRKVLFPTDATSKITNIDYAAGEHMGIAYDLVQLGVTCTVHVAKDSDLLKKKMKVAKSKKDWQEYFKLKDTFTDIRHAYSCTAHKSQGSTYKTVFIDVGDIIKNNKLYEIAHLMYVAVSRASDRVVLCVDSKDVSKEVRMLDLLKVIK